MSVSIDAEVLGDLKHFFDTMPARTAKAASRAINQVMTRSGRKRIEDTIYSEVAFPKGYLNLPGRLDNSKFAKPEDLEAIMSARYRATSLARFLTPGQNYATSKATQGVKVMVTPGVTKILKKTFPIRLNAGAQNTETVNNMGLAVRIKKGDTLAGGKGFLLSSNGKTDLWLLYTVSVHQIFSRVADEQLDAIGTDVTQEFMRQFTLLEDE